MKTKKQMPDLEKMQMREQRLEQMREWQRIRGHLTHPSCEEPSRKTAGLMKTKKQTTTEPKHDERDEIFINVLRSGAEKLEMLLSVRKKAKDDGLSLEDRRLVDDEFLRTVQLLETITSVEKRQIEDIIKSREVPTNNDI